MCGTILSTRPASALVRNPVHTFLPRGPFSPLAWQQRLQATLTEGEVVEVSRNFLATFAPFEIDTLPEVCQPGQVRSAAEVIAYASRLVEHRCDDGAGIEYAIHRLSSFFAGASARIDELRIEAQAASHHASA